MEFILNFIDIFVHLDEHISWVIQQFGVWTYVIFFVIIFCETGLVVTPFLPGDSLLFGLGTFAARGDLHAGWLIIGLSSAAIAGNTVNYAVGKFVGPKIFYSENVRLFRKEYLERTHRFYEKHGGKTIVIARFIPILRTFAPFVAGIGQMTYWRFTVYNVAGSLSWILAFILGGFYFGNLPFVKRHFTMVIIAIIIISVLPGVIAYIQEQMRSRKD